MLSGGRWRSESFDILAIDAQNDSQRLLDDGSVDPFYTLADQLFVERNHLQCLTYLT